MGSKAMFRDDMTASKRFALEMQQKVPLNQRPMGYADITKGIQHGVDRAAGRQVAEQAKSPGGKAIVKPIHADNKIF